MNRVWVRNLGSYNLSLGTGIRLPLASILPSLTGDRFQLDSVISLRFLHLSSKILRSTSDTGIVRIRAQHLRLVTAIYKFVTIWCYLEFKIHLVNSGSLSPDLKNHLLSFWLKCARSFTSLLCECHRTSFRVRNSQPSSSFKPVGGTLSVSHSVWDESFCLKIVDKRRTVYLANLADCRASSKFFKSSTCDDQRKPQL